jgi:hypothetical protein
MSIYAETPYVVIKPNVFIFFSDLVSHAKTKCFEQATATSLSCIVSLLLHHLSCNNILNEKNSWWKYSLKRRGNERATAHVQTFKNCDSITQLRDKSLPSAKRPIFLTRPSIAHVIDLKPRQNPVELDDESVYQT